MRSIVFSGPLILALLLPASAGEGPTAVTDAAPDEPRIERLFGELRRAGNERAAQRIAASIQQELMRSGSASIDLLMQWADKAMRERKHNVALDLLDQVVLLEPGFAEGWNRRATLHFTMNDYAKSMADISRTLELEPRHFGALGGLAQIMRATDRKELAVAAYERLLSVYPMMRNAQTELGKLADELAGEGI